MKEKIFWAALTIIVVPICTLIGTIGGTRFMQNLAENVIYSLEEFVWKD